MELEHVVAAIGALLYDGDKQFELYVCTRILYGLNITGEMDALYAEYEIYNAFVNVLLTNPSAIHSVKCKSGTSTVVVRGISPYAWTNLTDMPGKFKLLYQMISQQILARSNPCSDHVLVCFPTCRVLFNTTLKDEKTPFEQENEQKLVKLTGAASLFV